MSETAERRSRLEEWTNQPMAEPASAGALVPVAPPAHLPGVYGAQKVAVLRDDRIVLQKVRALAAAAGEDWYYRFPVKNRKENRTDWIEGPSIKLANDLARIYGNCEVDCRVEDYGTTYMFYARFLDLETGYALTRPFQQRKSAARIGGADEGRRDDMALQIGASKAIRNVVVNALQTYADFAFDEAKGAIIDRIGSDLAKWRETVARRITALVSLDRVEAVVGRKVGEWLAPDVARVMAMGKAISDGMASVDETFPPLGKAEPEEARSRLETFADGDKVEDVVEEAPVEPRVEPGAAQAAADASRPENAGTPPAAAMAIVTDALRIASDSSVTAEKRLARIEKASDEWFKLAPGKFVLTVVDYATKVALGELEAEKARKYLAALAPQ